MCTLTFLPLAEGFALAMNRDEQHNRPVALPPARHTTGTRFAIYPTEPGGGTWIGIQEGGLAMALLNWYAHPVRRDSQSRGRLIPQLLACSESQTLTDPLTAIDLNQTNPFRLVMVDNSSRSIREFRWDGVARSSVDHPWQLAHWYSSAFDESKVMTTRTALSQEAALQPDAGTIPWARRLHSSHHPGGGPYSICMHRADAKTVSYTEVETGPGGLEVRYLAQCPCEASQMGESLVKLKL